jgi:serine/threonine protein kinase
MSLTAGSRLGVYQITGLIGAGGMGEVYRARDTRLGRDVAIKVLPTSFAADPERHARFEREARVLAALNHPNIAAIYGVEEHPSPSAGATSDHRARDGTRRRQDARRTAASAKASRRIPNGGFTTSPTRGRISIRTGLLIGKHDTTSDIVLIDLVRR